MLHNLSFITNFMIHKFYLLEWYFKVLDNKIVICYYFDRIRTYFTKLKPFKVIGNPIRRTFGRYRASINE